MRVGMARAAQQELADTVARYDREREGLGEEFLEEFACKVEQLRAWPNACLRVSRRSRRCQMNRFPFGIVYQVLDDRIRIIAVMHMARRPGYWKDREQA